MRFDWRFGAAQFSEYDADGFCGIQIDPQGDDGGAATIELAHAFGFSSRPLDPDSDGLGCSVLIGKAGSRDSWAWLGHDPRLAEKVPQLTKGGSVQYSAKGTFSLQDGDEGTWTQYVPCAWDGSGTPTKAHLIQAGLDGNGLPSITIVHSDGMSISMIDGKTVLANKGGTAYIEIGDDGIVLNGNVKLVGGCDIGGSGGFPLINHTAFTVAWAALMAAVPAAPVPGAPLMTGTLGVALAAFGAALQGCQTVVTKGK